MASTFDLTRFSSDYSEVLLLPLLTAITSGIQLVDKLVSSLRGKRYGRLSHRHRRQA